MGQLMVLMLLMPMVFANAEEKVNPQKGWNFAFKDFIIAAWNPPAATDAEYEVYKQAGFNVVMSPRYALPDEALDLAQKHGLKLLVDTYIPNDTPWGGTAAEYRPHPLHHPATLPELKWLHERYGDHPALAGYLLGDDYGGLPQELVDTTAFMRENAPHLIPWVCQNVMNAESLAKAGNPIMDPQIYPTLYQADLPVEKQCELFCNALQKLRRDSIKYKLTPWPMFNICGVESDSLIRFQIYSSLAYGAQGIWYFMYSGGLQKDRGYETIKEVKENLLPAWKVSAQANHKVASWGRKLLGRHCLYMFHTGWMPEGAKAPGKGKFVEEMSDNLLVSVFFKMGRSLIAVVVDKRVGREFGDIPEREVKVKFENEIAAIYTEDGRQIRSNSITLKMHGGAGHLLTLAREADMMRVDAVKYRGGTGNSLEEAVIIIGAEDSAEGVKAEYEYAANVLGVSIKDLKLKNQSTVKKNQRHYDILTFTMEGQEEETFFFDISDFFGKPFDPTKFKRLLGRELMLEKIRARRRDE